MMKLKAYKELQDEIERIKTRLPYPVDVITYTDTDYSDGKNKIIVKLDE